MRLSRTIKSLIKLAVIIISYGFIVYKLSQYDLISTLRHFSVLAPEKLLLITVSFLMMFLNWGIEAIKWKFLINKLENISFSTSIKAVLSGITVSIFTPNRIGEYGGRIFVLKKENRISGILSTIVGSISQLLITLIVGIISLILFLYLFPEKSLLKSYNTALIQIFLVLTAILSLLIYFNIGIFTSIFSKFRFLKNHIEYFEVLSEYKGKELLYTAMLSFIRYIIFVSQFILLLKFCETEISYPNAFLTISITYLIVAIIPTITLTEVGVRGSVAIFCIGMFTNDEIGIISASVLLWIINLTIPALTGSYYLYRTKI